VVYWCNVGRCRVGQAVLATTALYWTIEAEEAMKTGGAAGLTEYGKKCTTQVRDGDGAVCVM
jgi:hypothetical protein